MKRLYYPIQNPLPDPGSGFFCFKKEGITWVAAASLRMQDAVTISV